MDILGVQNKVTSKIHRIREFIEFNRVGSLEKIGEQGRSRLSRGLEMIREKYCYVYLVREC